MKIMLATPPGSTTELWPPLGLLYIAASINERRGDEVKVVDAFCRGMQGDDLVKEVLATRPDVLGMNCSTHTFLDTVKALAKISESAPDTLIVLGGYHATFTAKRILRTYPFIDYVIKGEAERSFVDLLNALEEGRSPSNVDGIVYLDGKELVERPYKLIEDLDSLPAIDRDLLQGVEYGYGIKGIPLTFGKFTTMTTSRGCPFNCSYCSCAALFQRKWRARSVESVVNEMEALYDQGYKNVVLVDDNFTFDQKRTEGICDALIERRVRLRLFCEGRANNASYLLLKKMKRAGFDVIYFGAESAVPKTLDFYHKNVRPEQVQEAVSNAKRNGMIVITSFILGAPVESEDDMRCTIDFIRQLRPHGVQLNILDYLVGTPLWEEAMAQGALGPDSWRTNHRVYECYDVHKREDLEGLVDMGYDTYIDSWKNLNGVVELLGLLFSNRTARRVVFSNLFNRNARSTIMNGWK